MVSETVAMLAVQLGKTEMVLNVAGYFMAHDPTSIICVQPTEDLAEAWSKERLAPTIRDTPVLRAVVKDPRTRDSGNTIRLKMFPGGSMAIVGANAPSGLAGRPRRVVLQDEIDRYPKSAGTEGDPTRLADARAETFWNAVRFKTSTPTIKGASRVEAKFDESDKRRWFVPCRKCRHRQTLRWENVRWEKDRPETAHIVCEKCATKHNDDQRRAAVRLGEWRATAPFTGIRGYHLNGIYSPFPAQKGFVSRLHQMVAAFLSATKAGREALQTWTNTFLAESFEDYAGEQPEWSDVYKRRTVYAAELPDEVLVVTAGVDIQDNRAEIEFVGHGLDDATFGISHVIIPGEPQGSKLWADVDAWLLRAWSYADGRKRRAAAVCVDSGRWSQFVYSFVRPRQSRRVYAVKGSSILGAPLVARPKKSGVQRVTLYMVGTDAAKETIYSRLNISSGTGQTHFPAGEDGEDACGYDEEFFRQLTAEKMATVYERGKKFVKFTNAPGVRNEGLDCRVYATAGFGLLNANMERISEMEEKRKVVKTPVVSEPVGNEPTAAEGAFVPHHAGLVVQAPALPPRPLRGPRRAGGGFVGGGFSGGGRGWKVR